ncbi:MAG: N-acetyltransferase family protein [Bacteroidota bacterium]|jgi:phosphinothricin acetyltransferase
MIVFRELKKDDWEVVSRIYKEGIESGNATFQTEIPPWESWDKEHLKNCRIVAVLHNHIVAWAALTSVSGRCVYAGVAEVSVYVSNEFRGRKIGEQILGKLIGESEKEEIWTLQAGIFPENLASIKIHKNQGFREIGYREKIGKMNGVWRDTVLLERRSKTVGL